jgi:hypothetical protein
MSFYAVRSSCFKIYIGFFLGTLFIFSSCGGGSEKTLKNSQENLQEEEQGSFNSADIRILNFQNADSTWGFTIYINGRPYIHQMMTPGIESIPGFSTKEMARGAGEIIVRKLKRGKIPAGLTKKELDSLGVFDIKQKAN